MVVSYKPKNKAEKFGEKIFHILVENFPQTFFVGGTVRDILLEKKVIDIDIATSAQPKEVIRLLLENEITYDDSYNHYGVIVAKNKTTAVEIATLRHDLKSSSRYPKVRFIKSLIQDSIRRDFTVNCLYLSLKSGKILDPQKGLPDLKNKLIRFIGNPKIRIQEDPLRIIRAIRFALLLNFKLENKTFQALNKYFPLTERLTQTRIQKEINKLNTIKLKKQLQNILNKKAIDKYFKQP